MMTRRCAYCTPKHLIGPDLGEPYTDGMCKVAYYRESMKLLVHYQIPIFFRNQVTYLKDSTYFIRFELSIFFRSRVVPFLRRFEDLVWQLALVYLLAQILRWSLNDFAIVAK